MAEKRKERVQFDFSLEALQRVDNMKQKTEASTRAEVVRSALKLYEWFVNEVDLDSTVKVFDKNSEVVAIIPAKLLLK